MLGNFQEIRSDTKYVTIDIETVDPRLKERGTSWVYNQGHILGIACKLDSEPSCYYPLRHKDGNLERERCIEYFTNLFWQCYDKKIPIIGHYLYYDLGWLQHEGFIDITKCPSIFDTLNVSQLYDSTEVKYSLEYLIEKYKLGKKMETDPTRLFDYPLEVVIRYACNDVDITYLLAQRLIGFNSIDKSAIERESKIIPIIVQMKKQGIKIDQERLVQLEKEFNEKLQIYMSSLIKEIPNIKIWSNSSIEILFKRLQLSYPRTEKGNPSFEGDFLEQVGKTNPIINDLACARKIHRLNNNFIAGIKELQHNWIIHPDYFNGKAEDKERGIYGGTITGRFSSANPNIQQVPSRTEEGMQIRSLMIPNDGIAWGRYDYSQQEPKLMLHYAAILHLKGIEDWKKKYEENPDADFYDVLTEATGIDDRFIMKTNTLALSYGMGIDHMSDMLNITKGLAQMYKDIFFKSVPWLPALRDFVLDKARKTGFVKTLGNRQLKYRPEDANKMFNKLIQGSAADQTKEAMIKVYEETRKIPLCQVHDELGYELNEEELNDGTVDKITECMKNAFELQFPVKVDFSIGQSWKETCLTK